MHLKLNTCGIEVKIEFGVIFLRNGKLNRKAIGNVLQIPTTHEITVKPVETRRGASKNKTVQNPITETFLNSSYIADVHVTTSGESLLWETGGCRERESTLADGHATVSGYFLISGFCHKVNGLAVMESDDVPLIAERLFELFWVIRMDGNYAPRA